MSLSDTCYLVNIKNTLLYELQIDKWFKLKILLLDSAHITKNLRVWFEIIIGEKVNYKLYETLSKPSFVFIQKLG